MPRAAYVMSVLGESPAVLSELLWWLAVRERTPIAGIEVWATGRGARRLRELVASEAWRALEDRTGVLPPLASDAAQTSAAYGFRIHTFASDGNVLDDVRSEAESNAVSAQLHDRVRDLRADLPDDTQLVGSLAGGRKTVSASLQTAFSLQAGPRDRLVHVLLHADLEAALRREGLLTAFCSPGARWAELSGVPVDDQVLVYDVPFPRIRHLVPRRLSAALEHMPWEEVWPALDANMGLDATARLIRTAKLRWRFEIIHPATGEGIYETKLVARPGAVLAAMASVGEGATASDVVAWLDANEVGWAPPSGNGHDAETRQGALRSAVSNLRSAFADLPIGLERFGPPPQGFSVAGVEVDIG